MLAKIGDRVGAIRNATKDAVFLFGYGTYSEEIPPPDPIGKRGMVDFVHHAHVTNPKITLDNGIVIWGAECWWVLEEAVKKEIGNRQVKLVTPAYEIDYEEVKS